jgi:hypothetical protein
MAFTAATTWSKSARNLRRLSPKMIGQMVAAAGMRLIPVCELPSARMATPQGVAAVWLGSKGDGAMASLESGLLDRKERTNRENHQISRRSASPAAKRIHAMERGKSLLADAIKWEGFGRRFLDRSPPAR